MPESVKVETKTSKEARNGKEEDKNELVSIRFPFVGLSSKYHFQE